ncbi:CAP domain-containing protein [Streptomyces erythrochromogenes]|uniref:CAP domain-containing protein n=1 Tax=Streptomyces erythrochromogenes TaxID=285574 RepID=UPI00381EA827
MSRSRTPETQTRVEARRKKTVRTRIVLSVTTAAAVVAVGVAVADSGDDARTDRRTDAAGTSSGTASPTPDAASPTTDAAATASASASATPEASASASATPTAPATTENDAETKSESSPAAKPTRKPATTTGGGSGSTGGSGGGGGGGGGSTGGGGGTVNGDAESAVLALVNKERAAAGCGALTSNPKLSAAARGYSDTMARAGVMSHTGPDGSTMTSRVEAAGYKWSNLGENIARGQADADAVMKAWMNSSGHRANILNCAFKEIGIGVHKGDGGPWWTQNFGAPR